MDNGKYCYPNSDVLINNYNIRPALIYLFLTTICSVFDSIFYIFCTTLFPFHKKIVSKQYQ